MSLRVALYAEGAGEALGAMTLPPAPGEALRESHLGPAHVLVRRVLSEERRMPENAVHFVAPLRSDRGTVPRGSMLHTPKSLRRLLTWASASLRPDLAIVLVDQDDVTQRKRDLVAATEDLVVDHVIAVAVKEFEAWLLADPAALRNAVGPTDALPPEPEGLPCGEAKKRMADLAARWVSGREGQDERGFRREVATTCDLTVVANHCPSFAAFRNEARGR